MIRRPGALRKAFGDAAESQHGSASVTEECGQVFRNRRGLLNRGEVAAAGKDCPPLDVVYALQIWPRRLPLWNGLMREDAERRRCAYVDAVDRMPAIVPIIAHRRGDGLRDPVEGERGAEEVVIWGDVAP